MKSATLHRWSVAHTWSSLICTLFLLVICVTGLPLIFSDEIEHLSDAGPPYEDISSIERATADELTSSARQAFPGEIIRSVYWPDNQPAAVVTLAPSDDADDALDHRMTFDARTGLERAREPASHRLSFMDVMYHLHEDLFVDLPGELFLGLMALLFAIAIVSGIVLYAPFMRHVEFGKRRSARGSRVAWLDLHNMLSAAALLWMGVVGLTGALNELATPLFVHWLETDVSHALPPNADKTLPTHLASVTGAIQSVKARMPGRRIETVDFPTHHFGSARHYVVWTKGDTPLTSRIYIPVFVDAASGQFVMAAAPPWYLLALEISRPLHFGDYGGMPLKTLWALFDVLTIIVLISGVKLWMNRRRIVSQRRSALAQHSVQLTR